MRLCYCLLCIAGGWATGDGCAAVKKDATSSSQQATNNPSVYKAFIPSKVGVNMTTIVLLLR
jgi:hypothetical protein